MKHLIFFFVVSIFLPAALKATEGAPVILPENDPQTDEPMQLSWPTESGVRYRVETNDDLQGAWEPVEGYPIEAVGPAMRERFFADTKSKFFRVVPIDEQAPEISERDPEVDDYAVPRFGDIVIDLSDYTGVDPSSIALEVGDLGTFTTNDAQLDFADGSVLFDNGGDVALGGYGEVIQVSLSVADTLGNSATRTWSFTLEKEVVEADNVFTFGSPDAQRAGQRIRDIPTRVLAERVAANAGPIRMAANVDPWTLHSVESDRIVIEYEGDTPPTSTFQTGTYVKNLTPASMDEIFYREVTGTSDDAQANLLTIFTTEASLTDMIEEGTYATDEDTVAFEVGEDGTIQRAIVLIDSKATFERLGFNEGGLTFSMEDSNDTEILSVSAETLDWALKEGKLEAKLDIGLTGLKQFRAVFSSDFEAEAIFGASVSAQGSSVEGDLITEIPFGQVVVPIGAVYVFIDGALGVSGRASASADISVTAGFRQTASGRFGFDNEKGPIFDLDPDAPEPISPEPGASGELSFALSVEPRIDVSLYKVAGVEFVPLGLRVGPKFRVTGDGTFTGDLEAAAFGKVQPEGPILDLMDFEPELSRDYLTKRIRLFPDSGPLEIGFSQVPQSQTVDEGDVANLMCSLNRTGNVAYQWYHNDLPLPGATGAHLKLRDVDPAHYGQYSVEATAGNETIGSESATLRVESDDCDYEDTYPYPNANPGNVDDWNFYFRECTSYVAWKLNRIMKERFHNQLGGERFSDAHNWDDNATDIGLTVNLNPAVGAVAHWDKNEKGMSEKGHVAFVESVNADGTVNVSEYNKDVAHGYGVRCGVEAPRYIHVRDSDYQARTALEGFARIPAGSFMMGDQQGDGYSDEQPVHEVYISEFYMGKTEVTYAQWQEVYDWAVSNGYGFDNPGSGKGPNHPVQDVRWWDVVKWCNAASERAGRTPVYRDSDGSVYRTGWIDPEIRYGEDGYRLPTEAEWEKAARGGLSGKRFPWGDTISHQDANYYARPDSYSYDVSATEGYHPDYYDDGGFPYTSPVGSFDANGYGLHDMAGNLWEWCNDWHDGDYYANSPESNPRGPASGSFRVDRGGGWNYNAYSSRAADRGRNSPDDGFYLGFRLARSQ